MRKLFQSIHDDNDIIVFVEHLLLNSSNASANFAACLLNELMGRSQQADLGIGEKSPLATLNMSLFSLVLRSISIHPKNEKVLRPYIQTIVAVCFRRAVDCDTTKWPDNHLILIRKLFRTITNGKNEDSYKEIVPLLATLLNGLYRLFCRSQNTILKKIVIELCITVPARLSSLLPHLSLLLRMIIPALQSGEGELVNAG
jgi:transformation/transcription domain-associated protein